MGIADYLVIALVALVMGIAAAYVYRSKKKGKGCIGCPCAGSCGGKCGK